MPQRRAVRNNYRSMDKRKNIDVLGTGGMSQNWDVISSVLDAAKSVKPDIITIVGGAIVVSDPELALTTMKIDFGILGEGEATMLELAGYLCRNEDPKNIDGITYLDKDKNKVIVNRNRARINNLDELPFPDYESFEFDQWKSLIRFSGQANILDKMMTLIMFKCSAHGRARSVALFAFIIWGKNTASDP